MNKLNLLFVCLCQIDLVHILLDISITSLREFTPEIWRLFHYCSLGTKFFDFVDLNDDPHVCPLRASLLE